MTAYYYNQKEKNKINARNHTYEMQELFPEEIKHSISKSYIYDHNTIGSIDNSLGVSPNTIIENTDTVSAIMNHRNDSNITVLNFASYRHPGGMYINGSMAQEEALCSESFLYNVLKEMHNFYVPNSHKLNSGLYSDRLIYSADVIFSRGSNNVKCGVITCAAPNFNHYLKEHDMLNDDVYAKLLYNRIMLIKQAAELHNTHTLILGAWGCGVFKNDPKYVASAFKDVFSVSSIENIVYAIPSDKDGNSNYKTFLSVLERL